MIDTRAVGQELQAQLVGAARKGREQARKAQEQVRKGQEQARKGQEAVTEIVKSLTSTAEALRPQLPTVKLKLPSLQPPKLPDSAKLKASAEEVAEQLMAAQRKLTEQVSQAAGPLLAQGVARFGQAAQTLRTVLPAIPSIGGNGHSEHADQDAAPAAGTSATSAPAAGPPRPRRPARPRRRPARKVASPAPPRGRRSSTPRPPRPHRQGASPKSTPAKTSAAKSSAAKVSGTKASTAKASTAKPSTDEGRRPQARHRQAGRQVKLASPRRASGATSAPAARSRGPGCQSGVARVIPIGHPARRTRRARAGRRRRDRRWQEDQTMTEPRDSQPRDNQMEALGAFIRSKRKLANLSLRQLAERTRLSNPYLSQIERGLHQPSVRVIRLISDALNVSAESLLTQAGCCAMTTPGLGRGTAGGQRGRRHRGRGPAQRRAEERSGGRVPEHASRRVVRKGKLKDLWCEHPRRPTSFCHQRLRYVSVTDQSPEANQPPRQEPAAESTLPRRQPPTSGDPEAGSGDEPVRATAASRGTCWSRVPAPARPAPPAAH